MISADRMRLAVRAQPIATTGPDAGLEVAREIDTHTLRDKIAHGQAIPTPEETYEQLWQQLQQDLDERYG